MRVYPRFITSHSIINRILIELQSEGAQLESNFLLVLSSLYHSDETIKISVCFLKWVLFSLPHRRRAKKFNFITPTL